MRWAARTDSTQTAIVEALRDIGCEVAVTSRVGGGFPDLVASRAGDTVLIETKTKGGKLNPAQTKFHQRWRGRIGTAWTPEQAIKLVLK